MDDKKDLIAQTVMIPVWNGEEYEYVMATDFYCPYCKYSVVFVNGSVYCLHCRRKLIEGVTEI